MSVISYIKQKIYNFFNPSIEECFHACCIVEPKFTKEDIEQARKLLEEWKEEHNVQ